MHIRRHGDGWRAFVRYNGRKRSVVAATRAEAERKGAQLLIEMGGIRTTSEVTVSELLINWLERTEADHAPTYHLDCQRVIGRLPEPFLLRTVSTVDAMTVDMLYRQLTKAGWSPHRLQRIHRILATAWTQMAIPYKYTTDNPMKVVRPPTCPPSKAEAPPIDTARRVLLGASGQIRLFLELAARTGARRGELCALQWSDIGDTQVIIRRSISTMPGRRTVIGNTKTGTAGQRVVAIDAVTAGLLRTHRLEQVALALRVGKSAPVWVFSDTAGAQPWRTDFITREFANLCKRAGVTGVRLHDLRHLMASQMLAGGVPLTTVSKRLGHTQLSTTSDTYGHYVPAADQAAADLMGQRFDLG